MHCPNCDADTPDDQWNCPACRINLYWAHRHYNDLAGIRDRQGLPLSTATPAFLLRSHQREMSERASRSGAISSKVRDIARREMQHQGSTAE